MSCVQAQFDAGPIGLLGQCLTHLSLVYAERATLYSEEVLASFQESPFFSRWDPAVLRLYVDHGVYDDPKGGVSLKMSGMVVLIYLRSFASHVFTLDPQEALVFAEALTSYETWQLTPSLPANIELRFIMPGRPNVEYVLPLSDLGSVCELSLHFLSEVPRNYLVWLRPTNSSNVIITQSGHLIAQEAPRELGTFWSLSTLQT